MSKSVSFQYPNIARALPMASRMFSRSLPAPILKKNNEKSAVVHEDADGKTVEASKGEIVTQAPDAGQNQAVVISRDFALESNPSRPTDPEKARAFDAEMSGALNGTTIQATKAEKNHASCLNRLVKVLESKVDQQILAAQSRSYEPSVPPAAQVSNL